MKVKVWGESIHIRQWFPTCFVLGPFIFLEGIWATRLIFYIPLPSSLLSPLLHCLQQLGSTVNSPSRRSILEHSIGKSDRFRYVARDFPAFKALEISRFLPRISYFHHNGHIGSTLPAYPACHMGSFAVSAHKYFKNSLGGRGPLCEAWRATFGPRTTWEPLI